MTVKEYLSQAWNIDKRIDGKIAQASSLRDMTTHITQVLSDMPKSASHNNHRLQDVISRLMDTESEVDENIDRMVDLKIEIMNAIWKVEDIGCRHILEERYINFKSWEDIASGMNVSVRWVHKLHAKGLELIEKFLPKDTEVH